MAALPLGPLILLLALSAGTAVRPFDPNQIALRPQDEAKKVHVGFYSESLCPYCRAFTIKQLKDLWNNGILGLAELSYVPSGNARLDSTTGELSCQHGPRECELNRVLACALHLHPAIEAWFPFVTCLERDALDEDDTFELVRGCADSVDTNAIFQCAAGELGHQLQVAAFKRTDSLWPRHQYVPWVVVEGVPLADDFENLGKYICAAYQGKRPDACFDLPPPSLAAEVSRASQEGAAEARA